MHILITGSRGQLGTDLQHILGNYSTHSFIACPHQELDITKKQQVFDYLNEHRPDVVINTAASHKVDACETYPEKTFFVNTLGLCHLAKACGLLGIKLVHFSTNFVFDGNLRRPYREDDLPAPLNIYGTAKLAGEHLVRSICERHFIIRTSTLFGNSGIGGKGFNFIETMIQAGTKNREVVVVDDQFMSPTATVDLAQAVVEILLTNKYGTYHITNSGFCSYFELTRAIYHNLGISTMIKPITTKAYGSPAKRPLFSVLDNTRFCSLGIVKMPSWEDALDRYILDRKSIAGQLV